MVTILWKGILIISLAATVRGVYGTKEIFEIGVGESRKISIKESSSNVILIHNILSSTSALLFEAHSHIENITLSQEKNISVHYSVTGRNVGMVYKLLSSESDAQMWLLNKSKKNISVLIIVSSLDGYGLIPGGCNMEFLTEIAPYMRLSSKSGRGYLEYQHASISSFRGEPPPLCSTSLPYITYEVYVLFLKENNFSELEYFKKINTMSNSSLIKQDSKKVMSYSVHPDTRISFLMYPNVGVVYNVIARYTVNGEVREALYVPISSYGCGRSEFTELGCNFSYIVEGKAILFLFSMYGFITAFFGHYFFSSTMFFFGMLATFFVTLVVSGRFSSFSMAEILLISGILGIIGGVIWLIFWLRFRNSLISLLLIGFTLGFLVSASVLYSPLGNSEINLYVKNYWMILAAGSLFVTVLFIAYPTVLSILGSSVVGSYVMLLFYDDFIGTRLSYIILNIVKRAVSENLEFATNDYPFEFKDGVICASWVILSCFAIIVQYRSLFPSTSGCKFCFCKCRDSKRHNLQTVISPESNPHTPLYNDNSVFYNTFTR